MGRLIDADELLNSERERCNGEPIVGTCTQNNQYLMDVIKKAKTVDAEPVRHGHWLDDIGDLVFLTREAAEQALKEMEDD